MYIRLQYSIYIDHITHTMQTQPNHPGHQHTHVKSNIIAYSVSTNGWYEECGMSDKYISDNDTMLVDINIGPAI